MLAEQAAQLPSADTQPPGQRLDAGLALVERALGDQLQGTAHRIRAAAPEGELRRGLRPAAQAGAEPRLLRRRRRGEVAAVRELGRAGWADRPAIDAGRGHADEDAAVEAGVMGLEDPVAGIAIQKFHVGDFATTGAPALAVFGRVWNRVSGCVGSLPKP